MIGGAGAGFPQKWGCAGGQRGKPRPDCHASNYLKTRTRMMELGRPHGRPYEPKWGGKKKIPSLSKPSIG